MADPTFNENLFDAILRHQIGLLRFSGSVRNDIWKLLDASESDLKRQIKAATRAGLGASGQVKALESLFEKLRKTRLDAWNGVTDEWVSSLTDLSLSEPKFVNGIIASTVPVELGTILPAPSVLRNLVKTQQFMGKTLLEHISENTAKDFERIHDQIVIGLTQGESLPAISRRVVGTGTLGGIDGATQITRNKIDSLVRTSVSAIGAAARADYFDLNKDLISKKVFTATLDSRTTQICRSWDGSVHDTTTGLAISGLRVGQPSPVLPLHFGERSVYSPAVDGEVVGERPIRNFTKQQLVREYASENGLGKITGNNRKNLPFGHKGAFDAFARIRMRELTGIVPAKTTYTQFLRRQTAAVQDDILGVTRGALFRRGGLTLDKFVLVDGTDLTLDQLATRHAAAFKAAGLDPSDFK